METNDWFTAWCDEAAAWWQGAFPGESFAAVGLCLDEESSELIETLDLGAQLAIRVGKLNRTILKEGHGVNDRRAHVDWLAEREKEMGDVMIALAKIMALDGMDIRAVLEARLAAIKERWNETHRVEA